MKDTVFGLVTSCSLVGKMEKVVPMYYIGLCEVVLNLLRNNSRGILPSLSDVIYSTETCNVSFLFFFFLRGRRAGMTTHTWG